MRYSKYTTPSTSSINALNASLSEAPGVSSSSSDISSDSNTLQTSSAKRIPNINKLVRDESVPVICDKCGKYNLKYIGLGQYKCNDCDNLMLDNYGKVRQCFDIGASLTDKLIIQRTGLTKREVRQMINDGSLVRTVDGLSLGK